MDSPDSERASGTRARTRSRAVLVAAALVLGAVGAKASAGWLGAVRFEAEPPTAAATAAVAAARAAELEEFVITVAKDADAVWAADFRRRGKPYAPARPVLLEAPSSRDCGPGLELGRAECLGTNDAHIDLSFQQALITRLGEEASAARAYVVAHELGHHVQRVLGMDAKVEALLAGRRVASQWLEVQLELQADCLAGIWSRRTTQKHWASPAELEAALRHASEVGTERRLGDDRLDESGGETFTYAIPRRRLYWFARGFTQGELDDCDTFAP